MYGECVLHWFNHIERIENDKVAERVNVGECVGSRLVGRPRKRWTDSLNEEKRFECSVSKKDGVW